MSIIVDKISYIYEIGTGFERKALDNVSCAIEDGEFIGLIGHTGSGKSTLLSLLAGLDEPKSGAVLYNNEDIKIKGYEKHRKNNISLIFQNYNLIDYMTPLENLKIVNPKADKSILNDLGLKDDEINRNVLQLSGGQQQRVAIARALVSKPAIILADEPTGNLDSRTSSDVLGLLKVTSQKFHQTLVMITHNNEIAQLADRIIRIEDGKIAQ